MNIIIITNIMILITKLFEKIKNVMKFMTKIIDYWKHPFMSIGLTVL